jgi:HSP20 family protein
MSLINFDTLVDDFWLTNWRSWAPISGKLKVDLDVSENPKSYCLCAEVPGVKKKDLKVDFQGKNLTISGEKSHKTEKEDQYNHMVERTYGKFERTLRLPENADFDKLKAKFENGVLEIEIPKKEINETPRSKVNLE